MNKKGFTLVELIAVVVILGLISTITFASLSVQKNNVNKKEITSLRSSVISAFQIYRTNNNVKDEENIAISNLKFTGKLYYDKKECDLDNSYVKYVIRGNIDKSSDSKEEIFCVKLKCGDKYIINDQGDSDNIFCSMWG